ncbi:MAG TPA: thiosulfate oxidation carrier protein SoxY [Burkholderiales bacterium]|jgi:sulfur-oxidizing protein SoxY|nr:thiosulfate oxidation carrier protein SoxY [Burkholderiales bacterium]
METKILVRLSRRTFLRSLAIGGGYLCVFSAGWLRPVKLFAAEWNQAAFEAKVLADTLKGIGALSVSDSDQIQLKAPEIAENGAIVPVEITSKIPGTQAIYIIADKNPQPLVAIFELEPNLEPYISTRIKMGESSKVRVLIRAGGKFYMATQEVKVTIGGCGG